ncbi:MAG TPA: serine hydrolase domain-containing protein [Arenimonas sp.]|nr:serine hydrolase domain-containing protein [Arenimonas sp.]
MHAANASSPKPSRLRWLARHLLRFTLVCLLLLGPNLVFFGIWAWPKQPIPTVDAASDEHFAAESLSAQHAAALLAALRESREQAGLVSLSAAVAFDGRLQWAGATGWADVERALPASIASRYRTGSVAKSLTAVAMMRLVDAGQLGLDDPLSAHVEGLPAHLQPLTAGLLASHRAGVRHYSRIPSWWMGWHEGFSRTEYASVADGLAVFADDELRFAPATDYHYTTFGYSLLARLLEGASGTSFEQVLQQQLFAPADMRDTTVDRAGPMQTRVAFYQAGGGRFTPAYPINSSAKIAGGGMVSTPSDLARLGQALLGDALLSADAKQAMFTPQALADGRMNPENYALGWRVDTSVRLLGEDRPTPIIHHGGIQPGGTAFLMLLPEFGITVAVMSNSGTSAARTDVQEAAYALARQVIAR